MSGGDSLEGMWRAQTTCTLKHLKNHPPKQSTRPTSTSSCPLVIKSPNLISTGLLLDSLKPLGLICPGPSLGGDDLSGLLGGDGSFSLVSATTRTLFFLVSWRVEALDPVFQDRNNVCKISCIRSFIQPWDSRKRERGKVAQFKAVLKMS